MRKTIVTNSGSFFKPSKELVVDYIRQTESEGMEKKSATCANRNLRNASQEELDDFRNFYSIVAYDCLYIELPDNEKQQIDDAFEPELFDDLSIEQQGKQIDLTGTKLQSLLYNCLCSMAEEHPQKHEAKLRRINITSQLPEWIQTKSKAFNSRVTDELFRWIQKQPHTVITSWGTIKFLDGMLHIKLAFESGETSGAPPKYWQPAIPTLNSV